MARTADWYPDPSGRFDHRYWDGHSWTEYVGTRGVQHHDPINGRSWTPPATQQGTPAAFASPEFSWTATEKLSVFNARKIAEALQRDYAELYSRSLAMHARLVEVEGLDAVEMAQRNEQARREAEAIRQRIAKEAEQAHQAATARQAEFTALEKSARIALDAVQSEVENTKKEILETQGQLLVVRDRLEAEDYGLFDYEHPAEASAQLAESLTELRRQIRENNKIGRAITATSGFTFNNSKAKGQTFVNQMSRIMLRAYNAEAENAVKSVKAGNLSAAQKRLVKARDQILKQGTMIDLRVTDHYHHLRLNELSLAAQHLTAAAAEKEQERERRAELREERKVEAEIRKQREQLEKERSHYLNSIARLRQGGDEAGAATLEDELRRIDAEIEEAENRAANIRAGYVYVISNIGAFGEGVVKIGMTRRLDPMDRVRELGDASVPFRFDVHALFFSDDAVSIEAMLHREFAEERINKVNLRREFFRVHPEQVLKALAEHRVSVLEFTTHAAADDFRLSWPTGYSTPDSAPDQDISTPSA